MEEDAREVLVGFLKTELGMESADQTEFQRVHCVGKRVSSNGKPRQIIARFLKYPQHEELMSNARKFKGNNFGILPDLPSEILERRNKKIKQFKQVNQSGYEPLNLENGSFVNSNNCDAINLRF